MFVCVVFLLFMKLCFCAALGRKRRRSLGDVDYETGDARKSATTRPMCGICAKIVSMTATTCSGRDCVAPLWYVMPQLHRALGTLTACFFSFSLVVVTQLNVRWQGPEMQVLHALGLDEHRRVGDNFNFIKPQASDERHVDVNRRQAIVATNNALYDHGPVVYVARGRSSLSYTVSLNLDSLSGSNGISAASLTPADRADVTQRCSCARNERRRSSQSPQKPSVASPSSTRCPRRSGRRRSTTMSWLSKRVRFGRCRPTSPGSASPRALVGMIDCNWLTCCTYICNNLPDLLRRRELHVPLIFAAIRAVASDSRLGRREQHSLLVIGMRVVSF